MPAASPPLYTSPGVRVERDTQFRTLAPVLEYSQADEERGVVLEALKKTPGQHVVLPIRAPPILQVRRAMREGLVLRASDPIRASSAAAAAAGSAAAAAAGPARCVETVKFLDGVERGAGGGPGERDVEVQIDSLGTPAAGSVLIDTQRTKWRNFLAGIDMLRNLGDPGMNTTKTAAHGGSNLQGGNPLSFSWVNAGTYNSVWEPTSMPVVDTFMPSALRSVLTSVGGAKSRAVVRMSKRTDNPKSLPKHDDALKEAASMLEASRDGFGLQIYAILFQPVQISGMKFGYHIVTVMQRGSGTVGERWSERLLRERRLLSLLPQQQSAWLISNQFQYFERMKRAILAMSMRRIVHFDFSRSNMMDVGLPSPLRCCSDEHERALNQASPGMRVAVIDTDGGTYRRLHVQRPDSLAYQLWVDLPSADSCDVATMATGEGWRPIFLYNYLFVSCWLRLIVPTTLKRLDSGNASPLSYLFQVMWHWPSVTVDRKPAPRPERVLPSGARRVEGEAMARLVTQLHAEVKCDSSVPGGGNTVQRIEGRTDHEYEAAREFVLKCHWSHARLKNQKTDVDRPDGNDPATFAKVAREMATYYFYSFHYIDATHRFVLPLRRWAYQLDSSGQQRRPQSTRDLPDFLSKAVTWHQTYYLPKVLPAVYHFYQRTQPFGSSFVGTPTLLVDVMLEYINMTDEALEQNLGQIQRRRPRNAWSWVEEVFNNPTAFVDEQRKPTAMILEFPMAD